MPIPCPCGYDTRGHPYPWVKLPSLARDDSDVIWRRRPEDLGDLTADDKGRQQWSQIGLDGLAMNLLACIALFPIGEKFLGYTRNKRTLGHIP
jgi:hypothetical protein